MCQKGEENMQHLSQDAVPSASKLVDFITTDVDLPARHITCEWQSSIWTQINGASSISTMCAFPGYLLTSSYSTSISPEG